MNEEITQQDDEIKENGQLDPKVPYQSGIGLDYGRSLNYIALGLFKDQEDINNSPVQTWNDVKPGDIKYKDIPSVISWLQDIYTYGQQQLKKVEYVDFQTALAWMKENEDNEAKFGNNIFSYTYGNLWIRDEERNHITTLTLPMVESKEWIIIKED